MTLFQWLQSPRATGVNDGIQALQDDGHHRLPQVGVGGCQTICKDEADGCRSSGTKICLFITIMLKNNKMRGCPQPKILRGLEKQHYWNI